MAMRYAKAFFWLASILSFRRSQTAGNRYLATSGPTKTETGSSDCSTRSSSSEGSQQGTTKPKRLLPLSSILQQHASGYGTLSTEPKTFPAVQNCSVQLNSATLRLFRNLANFSRRYQSVMLTKAENSKPWRQKVGWQSKRRDAPSPVRPVFQGQQPRLNDEVFRHHAWNRCLGDGP